MTDTKTGTNMSRQDMTSAGRLDPKEEAGGQELQETEEKRRAKLLRFGSALDAAMVHGVGNRRKKWSRAALSNALTPPVDKSAIGLWVTARRAITEQNAYEVFRVMTEEPLTAVEFVRLEDMATAYGEAFPDRETGAIEAFLENCEVLEGEDRDDIPDQTVSDTDGNGMSDDERTTSFETEQKGASQSHAPEHDASPGTADRSDRPVSWVAIGAIAAVVAAVFAVTQYLAPISTSATHEVNESATGIQTGDNSPVNTGSGSQTISGNDAIVTVPQSRD